jgi:aminoglycoside phosphotransferase (APT) family kinase protein
MTNEQWIDSARPVRAGEELVPDAVEALLKKYLPGILGPVSVEQFPSGHSNLTYLVRAGEREIVLRRPPFGASAIKSGHDMGREFRILSGLSKVYAKVPSPLFFCPEADSPIGATCYAMARVRGVVLRASAPAGLAVSPDLMRRIAEAFVANLAELHAVDYRAAGLESIGRPEGYISRQVDGWTERYARAQTDSIRELGAVAEWLRLHIPEPSSASVVHNDYKYDNLVVDPADLSRIVAVLDWEMATLGDPVSDLGMALAYWVQPGDPEEILSLGIGATALPGNPTREELVSLYATASGRDVSSIIYYYVLGLFKVAVIAQQIYFRYAQGFTRDRRFAGLIQAVRVLASTARDAIRRGSI